MEKIPLNTAEKWEKMLNHYQMAIKVCVLGFLLSNLIWGLAYVSEVNQANNKIFVVSDLGTFTAASEADEGRSIYEMNNHVKTFAHLMFRNNAETFKKNVGEGLHLIERKDGDALYEQFSRAKTLENYQKYNSRSEIEIDSVRIFEGIEPYKGLFYAKQIIQYEKERVVQPLAFQFELVKTHRSDENPTGLLIRELSFIQYHLSNENKP